MTRPMTSVSLRHLQQACPAFTLSAPVMEAAEALLAPVLAVGSVIDGWFLAQAEALGTPVDLLKYVSCLLFTVPVGMSISSFCLLV